jgi:hypothetical protein
MVMTAIPWAPRRATKFSSIIFEQCKPPIILRGLFFDLLDDICGFCDDFYKEKIQRKEAPKMGNVVSLPIKNSDPSTPILLREKPGDVIYLGCFYKNPVFVLLSHFIPPADRTARCTYPGCREIAIHTHAIFRKMYSATDTELTKYFVSNTKSCHILKHYSAARGRVRREFYQLFHP